MRVSRCGTDMGRTDGRLAVDLGAVLAHDLGVVAAQELATDREPFPVPDLGNARRLQQRKRATAGADEHKTRVQRARRVARAVTNIDVPATVVQAAQFGGLLAEREGRTRCDELADELASDLAEVDIGAAL